MRTLEDIAEEYEFLEGDERYRLLIELGRELDPMPDALKTDAPLVLHDGPRHIHDGDDLSVLARAILRDGAAITF